MATPSYLRCPPYSTPRPVPGRHDPAAPGGRRHVSSCLTAAAARVTRATPAGKPGALRPCARLPLRRSAWRPACDSEGRRHSMDVWVAKDDGTEIIRAQDIAAVSLDYNGNVTARLAGGDVALVTLVAHRTHHDEHRPEQFHRELIRVLAEPTTGMASARSSVLRREWACSSISGPTSSA